MPPQKRKSKKESRTAVKEKEVSKEVKGGEQLTVAEGTKMLVDGMMAGFNEGMTGENDVDSDLEEDIEQKQSTCTGIGAIKRSSGFSGSKRKEMQEVPVKPKKAKDRAQFVKRPAMLASAQATEALSPPEAELKNALANKALHSALGMIQTKKLSVDNHLYSISTMGSETSPLENLIMQKLDADLKDAKTELLEAERQVIQP